MAIADYDTLAKQVALRDGVMTVQMGMLRDIHGAGKLGVNVCASISDALKSHGLSHYPETLSTDQWKTARLYKVGSAVGDLIKAVTTIDEKSDEVLRGLAGDRSSEVLKKIRDLVCD